ncbi:MAG TPA: hypothetical protein DHU69_06260 [Deltaproteobacteria bacterium]|nr:MAG: hypothetical protein A3D29_00795 [Deltaproteobacteria bacterium RIFCSPHIGHO2_02_FULL_42_44]HCY19347.1 hypothetical protein [Deltaproteobacteria bacterium]
MIMSQNKELLCFTIGHSIHPLSKFLKFLAAYNINCIIDVRSIPYLKYAARYNRDYLESKLKQKGIRYLFMGDILGTKYEDADLKFKDGKVDYAKVRKTKGFEEGVGHIIDEIKRGAVIAIMCSEKEPLRGAQRRSISYFAGIASLSLAMTM